MKSVFLAFMATLVGIAGATWGFQDSQRVETTSSRFMQRKLDYSREIVSGLTTENYRQIAQAAQGLMLLSHEADWNVITTPEYLKSSSDFRETVARLRQAGNDKNLDGATIAYFEVTLSCVRCHKQLRPSGNRETNK